MSLMRRMRNDVDSPEGFFERHLPGWPEAWSTWLEESNLRVEEFEEDGAVVIRAEMPGIDPDRDVEITISGEAVRIKGERRQETKTEDKKGFRSEFRYGSFFRSLPLPAGATEEDVKAIYQDGILEVRVPIDGEKAEAKKIEIARG